MTKIEFSATDFDSKTLSDYDRILNCSYLDLIRSAITVGKKNRSWVERHNHNSFKEMLFRAFMTCTFLEENDFGRVIRTSNFNDLDPSEKVAISYFFGLAGTKLISESKFNVPWLMHLDVYTKNAIGSDKVYIEKWKKDSKIRPDLIGTNQDGDWFVVEAKGRGYNMSSSNLQKAKQQTENIKTINNQKPVLRFANVTFFEKDEWKFSLIDPEDHIENSPDLKIDISDFLRDYYSTIFTYLLSGDTYKRKIGNDTFVLKELMCADLKIGMEVNIFNILKDTKESYVGKSIIEASKVSSFKFLNKEKSENYSIGYDGIIVCK